MVTAEFRKCLKAAKQSLFDQPIDIVDLVGWRPVMAISENAHGSLRARRVDFSAVMP